MAQNELDRKHEREGMEAHDDIVKAVDAMESADKLAHEAHDAHHANVDDTSEFINHFLKQFHK